MDPPSSHRIVACAALYAAALALAVGLGLGLGVLSPLPRARDRGSAELLGAWVAPWMAGPVPSNAQLMASTLLGGFVDDLAACSVAAAAPPWCPAVAAVVASCSPAQVRDSCTADFVAAARERCSAKAPGMVTFEDVLDSCLRIVGFGGKKCGKSKGNCQLQDICEWGFYSGPDWAAGYNPCYLWCVGCGGLLTHSRVCCSVLLAGAFEPPSTTPSLLPPSTPTPPPLYPSWPGSYQNLCGTITCWQCNPGALKAAYGRGPQSF